MCKFQVWVRLSSGATTNVIMYADNALVCRQLAESQYGAGQVLNVSYLND